MVFGWNVKTILGLNVHREIVLGTHSSVECEKILS
eukprot:UN18912